MTTKQQVREMLDRLPDNASLEDIQYALYIRQQIAEGLADEMAGRVYEQTEFDRKMARWLEAPAGPTKPHETSMR
jgi:hypothetical protein